MRVTPFLCRLHRSAFRYTGRVTDNGRHNQDIGVMWLPSGGLADLIDGGALGPLKHVDHGGLFAGLSGPDGPRLDDRRLEAQCLVAGLGDHGLALLL